MPADLTKITLFKGVQEADLRALGAGAQVREFPADAVVIKEGEPADSLYAILRGKVKVCLVDANGKEFVVDVRGAGQYVGEMMLDGKPRSASVKTVEPSQFAVISQADFKGLLAKHPEVALQLIRNLIRMTRGHNVQTLEDVRTREELNMYVEKLKSTKGQDLPSVKRWEVAKRWMLVTLLLFAIMQFYFIDVLLQTVSLGGVTVFNAF